MDATTSPTPPARIVDESDRGFSWVSPAPPWMERASHALASNGRVWLVDPVDFPGLEELLHALGHPGAVIQLLDRHNRDCAAIAQRLGVALHVNPIAVADAPFELVRVPATPRWSETALWWPERRTLVVAEALGTAPYYCAPGKALGVHPVLRLLHRPKALLRFEPEHLLTGHGAGLHEDVPNAIERAIRDARRELPQLLLSWRTRRKSRRS